MEEKKGRVLVVEDLEKHLGELVDGEFVDGEFANPVVLTVGRRDPIPDLTQLMAELKPSRTQEGHRLPKNKKRKTKKRAARKQSGKSRRDNR